MENLDRFRTVKHFVVYAEQVCHSFVAVLIVNTVNLLEMRIGDLFGIFADLDLGNDLSVSFNGNQFVNAAENRIALRRDQTFANAERVDFRTLYEKVTDNMLVKGVGNDDLTFGQALTVQLCTDFLGEISKVTGVQTNGKIMNALRNEDLLECADRIGQTALHNVISINQQGCVIGINAAIGLKRFVFGIEHLNPSVRHRTGSLYAEISVCDGVGRGMTSADIRRSCTVDRGFRTLCSARTEFGNHSAACCTNDTARLGCNQGLVIKREKDKGLNELCLHGGSANDHHGLARKYGRSFGNRIDITRKAEIAKIFQKFFVEKILVTQIFDIFFGKFQILDVVNDGFQACRNRITAAVGNIAEKNVEISNFVLFAGNEIAVRHC